MQQRVVNYEKVQAANETDLSNAKLPKQYRIVPSHLGKICYSLIFSLPYVLYLSVCASFLINLAIFCYSGPSVRLILSCQNTSCANKVVVMKRTTTIAEIISQARKKFKVNKRYGC